ncbi:MAG: hypothetical protein ACYCPN_07275 [Thermoplasmata archaeon]
MSVSRATEAKPAPTAPSHTAGIHARASVGGGNPPATTTAPTQASGHATAAAHAAATAKAGGVAGKASLLVKGLAVVGVGVAGLAAAAHTGAVPGLSVALSNVPVWTHAHAVLSLLSQKLHVVGRGALRLGL